MSLHTDFEFLFIGKDEGSFLENYSYDLTNEHGVRGGKLFIAIEIQNNPTDAEVIGETLADTIRRVFFTDIEADPYTRLEESLKAANKVIRRFKEEKISKFVGTFHVTVAAICGNELFLTATGDAESYLIRKKFVSVISEGLTQKKENEDPFINIASGTLERNDVVIFSTTRLLRYISQTDFSQCLSSRNIKKSLEKLYDYISPEILGKIGIIGIAIRGAEKEEDTPNRPQVHEEILKSSAEVPTPQESIKTMANSFYQKTSDFFKRNTNSPRRKQSKDKLLVGLIGIILVLTFGIWFTKNQSLQEEELLALGKKLDQAEVLISEAESKGQFNKRLAKEKLDQAQNLIVEVRNTNNHRNKANTMLGKIDETIKGIDKISEIKEPNVLADLTTQRPNVSALGIIGNDDGIFVYEYNALYEIIANQLKEPKTIDDNEVVVNGSNFDDRNSLIFATKNGKLIEYRNGQFQFSDSQDGTFYKGTDITDWSNRIYILDPENNQIWKYPFAGRSEKFNKPEGYIKDGDIANAIGLAIDSSVYVLKESGEILKFYSGKIQEFPIKKAPLEKLEKPTKIYTDADMPEIIILEPSKNRVLIYTKDDNGNGATYDRQYVFSDSDELRDIYFNKDEKRLYILSASKVYQQDI